MSNPKYKLTTPCPCCNSQVTVESYTDQAPKLTAVPSPVAPKPTGVAEAMTNIANSGVNILGSDSFAYADKGWAHDWGKWNPVGIYETLEQRRSRLLEEKIADLQRTVGRQSESLTSAHEKIKSLEKSTNSAHKRLSELEQDFEDFVESLNRRVYDLAKDSEAEKWRNRMQAKADKLNEITAIVYPVYERGNPQKMNPSDVYSQIKGIIQRPEPLN